MECWGLEPGGGKMVGADESTELWWHPIKSNFVFSKQPNLLLEVFVSNFA